MRRILYRLRHLLLFAVLIGSDFLLVHIGYSSGENGTGYGSAIAVSIVVIVFVEFIYQGGKK